MRWAVIVRKSESLIRTYITNHSCERSDPDRLVGPFQKILAEDHMYYNHYAIESAFKNAMNLDTMAVVHSAISACK